MNKLNIITILVLSCFLYSVTAADTEAWKSRTIYQILTDRFSRTTDDKFVCDNLKKYCGGTFKGIENKLDYIKGMGFDAIWISPVVDNVGDSAYHGYWPGDWEKIEEHFGTEAELVSLITAAHNKGIWVMVDVVANHVGLVGIDYSKINPFNKAEHYHPRCQIVDWQDQHQVEYCRLADLPDLDQDNAYVRQYLKDWIKNLVKKYKFDGIRVDTVPEVKQDFWKEFADAAGVYQLGECSTIKPDYAGPYQNELDGLVDYPMYYCIRDVWNNYKSMKAIPGMYTYDHYYNDVDALGIFIDNHDTSRFMHKDNNYQSLKSALVFAFTTRGIPIMYYGTEQGFGGGGQPCDPFNREPLWGSFNDKSEIYLFIKKVISAKKIHAIHAQKMVERYADDSINVFSRGKFLVAVTNSFENQKRTLEHHPFSIGEKICNIFAPKLDCMTIDSLKMDVYLNGGEQKIFIPATSDYFLQEDFKFLTK